MTTIKTGKTYRSINLFSGAGGLSLGLEQAGFESALEVDINSYACLTLSLNRPKWNVLEKDVKDIKEYLLGKVKYYQDVDLVSAGLPCQAFSLANSNKQIEDPRGKLFYDFLEVVKIVKPKLLLIENVPALELHNKGKTIELIKSSILEINYSLINIAILNAVDYKTPQERSRLFMIAISNEFLGSLDFYNNEKARYQVLKAYTLPLPDSLIKTYTLRDALFKGDLYPTDVPSSPFTAYSDEKKQVLDLVPEGSNWRSLPLEIQKQYMKANFNHSGGKTGTARRLSWDKPCPTLTTSPMQNRTEKCHPTETRPLAVREYARVQTFPDEWLFAGTVTEIYKQIGNAVPVNLALAIGSSLIKYLQLIESEAYNPIWAVDYDDYTYTDKDGRSFFVF